MSPVAITLTFSMLWWMIFLMALPFGVQRVETPQAGKAIGAPKNPGIIKKAVITTIITAILTFIFFIIMSNGWLDFLSPRE